MYCFSYPLSFSFLEPAMKDIIIPTVNDEFKRWWARKCDPFAEEMDSIKVSTFRSYTGLIGKFLAYEQEKLGASNVELDTQILDFSASPLILVPFPDSFRDQLPYVTTQKYANLSEYSRINVTVRPQLWLLSYIDAFLFRAFHHAYGRLVDCIENFFQNNFLNRCYGKKLEIESHFAHCRAKCIAVRSDLKRMVARGLADSKEKKRREEHLSQEPDKVLALMRAWKDSKLINRMRDELRTDYRDAVIKLKFKVEYLPFLFF